MNVERTRSFPMHSMLYHVIIQKPSLCVTIVTSMATDCVSQVKVVSCVCIVNNSQKIISISTDI